MPDPSFLCVQVETPGAATWTTVSGQLHGLSRDGSVFITTWIMYKNSTLKKEQIFLTRFSELTNDFDLHFIC